MKDQDKIEKFVQKFQYDLNNIRKMTNFLNISNDKESKRRLNNTLDILDRKLAEIKSAKNIDELKEHIKVKKLLNSEDDI